MEELRQRVEEWNGLDQRVIDTAIREWHKIGLLQACIAADREHFKHALLTLGLCTFAEMQLIDIGGRTDKVVHCINCNSELRTSQGSVAT